MGVFRVISRLDIKPPNLVKGVQLEGFRVLGSPSEFAARYYSGGVDEIICQDIVASLYGRPSQFELISKVAENTFVPLVYAGGIRTVEDAIRVVSAGADKVGINTAAISNPTILSEIAQVLGKQAVVAIVEAKEMGDGHWEALTESGRERSFVDVKSWVARLDDIGAGEILIVSVDRDGSKKGPDLRLATLCRSLSNLPMIYQGGVASASDSQLIADLGYQGVAVGAAFHSATISPVGIKRYLSDVGCEIRL